MLRFNEHYSSYSEFLDNCMLLRNNYPNLITINSIGKSHKNNDILNIKIGSAKSGPVFLSGVHGRENINPSVLLMIIDEYSNKLASSYVNSKDICMYFIPILNPDGYILSSIPSYLNYKLNYRGIDINRNFPCKSFRYSDTSGFPNSENETKSFVNFCNNNSTTGLIDFHSRGNTIYYFRKQMNTNYNTKQLYICKKLAENCNYVLNSPEEENPDGISGGNTVNYYSEYHNKPAVTIETLPDELKFPLDRTYIYRVFNEIHNIPMLFYELLNND